MCAKLMSMSAINTSKPSVHLTSDDYRHIAEACDNLHWDLVSVIYVPGGEGLVDHAYVTIREDHRSEGVDYATLLCIIKGRDTHFESGHYSMTRGQALADMARRAGVV